MTLLTPNENNKSIKEHISDNLDKILDFATLEKIPDDCPWKSFEGKSEAEFMQTLYEPLGVNNYFFEKIVPFVKDIAFVKVYAETIKKDSWSVLYLLGEDEDSEALFYCGGEPNLNPVMPSSITKNSAWKDYPKFLKDIWSIHGFWFGDNEFATDLSYISNLGQLEGGYDSIQHATKIVKLMEDFANKYCRGHKDDIEEFYDLALLSFDNAETADIRAQLSDGLFYNAMGNGDFICILNDEKDRDRLRMVYLCHDNVSSIYESFDKFLQYDDSRSASVLAENLNTESFEDLCAIANKLFESHNYQEAIIYFRKAFKLKPEDAGYLLNYYSNTLKELDDSEEELNMFMKNRADYSSDLYWLYQYIELIEDKKNDDFVDEYYEKLMLLTDHNKARDYKDYARFLRFNLKDYEKSEQYFLKSLEIDNSYEYACNGYACLLMYNLGRNFDKAGELLLTAMKQDKESSIFTYNYAVLQHHIKNYDEAKIYIEKALSLNPEDESAINLQKQIMEML